MTAVDSLIEGFPKPNPTKIIGIPTYESIKRLNDDISANGGSHGHLGMTVSPAIYATASRTPFVNPTIPDPPALTGLTGP